MAEKQYRKAEDRHPIVVCRVPEAIPSGVCWLSLVEQVASLIHRRPLSEVIESHPQEPVCPAPHVSDRLVRRALQRVAGPHDRYSLRSIRSGAATLLAQSGVATHELKQYGFWRSAAFESYTLWGFHTQPTSAHVLVQPAKERPPQGSQGVLQSLHSGAAGAGAALPPAIYGNLAWPLPDGATVPGGADPHAKICVVAYDTVYPAMASALPDAWVGVVVPTQWFTRPPEHELRPRTGGVAFWIRAQDGDVGSALECDPLPSPLSNYINVPRDQWSAAVRFIAEGVQYYIANHVGDVGDAIQVLAGQWLKSANLSGGGGDESGEIP